MEKRSFSEAVAQRLIEQIQQGTAPWQRRSEPGGYPLPFNPTSGTRYKGINLLVLMAQQRGDQRWMTYKQAQANGYQVRRGEKATQIQYWKFEVERQRKDSTGKAILDHNGQPQVEIIKLPKPQVFLAYVFNAAQIEGIPPQLKKPITWDPLEEAERILQLSKARITHDAPDYPFYRPSTDSIHLPDRGRFPTAANYYATALHELGHWTGHETRLKRDLSHPYGSEGYAREELRAEIASLIVGAELGTGYDPVQHAAYAASWVKILNDDQLEIFRAAADAEKIQNYFHGLQQQTGLSDSIKEYDRIVDGRPEVRKQLEQTNPALVASRDKAVTEFRREKANRELAHKQASQQTRTARR
jgi:putative DNA primase/helicase